MITEPVIVVGAGPVGLATALALRSLGLPVTLLEADPADRVRPGSRALFLHRDSLRLLDRMHPGLSAELAGHGVTWRVRRTCYRGREVYVRRYPPVRQELPPFTSIRQVETERFLLAACGRAGVQICWDAVVSTVTADTDRVVLDGADGQRWAARYVVAADGARSAVRSALGTALHGYRSKGFHVVVDIEEDATAPRPVERVLHYEHPSVGGRTVLLVPFAGGFQVDLQCHDADPEADFATAEAVRRWLPCVVDRKYADRVLWVSKYHFLQKVAETFVDPHHRVLLVGEAAHLFAPFGARGLNSGVADADAAASAVAIATAAANPLRASGAVRDFDLIRRAAGEYNRDAAASALAHLRPRGWLGRARRWGAAVAASRLRRCGAWLDSAPYGPVSPPPSNPTGRY